MKELHICSFYLSLGGGKKEKGIILQPQYLLVELFIQNSALCIFKQKTLLPLFH